MDSSGTPSRAQRRRRSGEAILTAATSLFAERGYERTTIRAIAAAAGVDPALVMQHYGSKDRLFAAVAARSADTRPMEYVGVEDLAEATLEHVFSGYEDPQRRANAVALLRSCLTNQAASEIVRKEVMGSTQSAVADTIGGGDADLRAAVLNACTLGLTVSRYLLRIPALAEADPDDIRDVLVPALRAIVSSDTDRQADR